MCSIYKLYVEGRDEVYVGSTKGSLAKRLWTHKNDLERSKTEKRSLSTACSLFALGDVKIQLLESCTVENRYQRERYWVENTQHVVNRYIPGRTHQERKEYMKQYSREYYLNHKKTTVDAEPTCS